MNFSKKSDLLKASLSSNDLIFFKGNGGTIVAILLINTWKES